MSDPEAPAAYETVTTNHAVIRRLVDLWEGRPAIAPEEATDAPVTLVFDDAPEGVQPVQWDSFFDRFEGQDLALAFDANDGEGERPAEYAFVTRPSAADGDAAGSLDPADHPVDAFDDDEADRPAEFRERRAEEHENVDNHRDEEPFQS